MTARRKGRRPLHEAPHAHPLVRRSYDDPIETWSTNVMGSAMTR